MTTTTHCPECGSPFMTTPNFCVCPVALETRGEDCGAPDLPARLYEKVPMETIHAAGLPVASYQPGNGWTISGNVGKYRKVNRAALKVMGETFPLEAGCILAQAPRHDGLADVFNFKPDGEASDEGTKEPKEGASDK